MLNQMDNVTIKEGEWYFLRLLPLRSPSPTSFTDLLLVNGVDYDSYQEICRAMGWLIDNKTWHDTLYETEACYPPNVVRSVFAQILAFGEVCDPKGLYIKHISAMAEDFWQNDNDSSGIAIDHIKEVVKDIEFHLNNMQMSLSNIELLVYLLDHLLSRVEEWMVIL